MRLISVKSLINALPSVLRDVVLGSGEKPDPRVDQVRRDVDEPGERQARFEVWEPLERRIRDEAEKPEK